MYNDFDDCFYEPEDDELLLRMMEDDFDDYDEDDLILDESLDDEDFPF